MARIAYKRYIEQQLGVTFKPSKQAGFQYLAIEKHGGQFLGSENDAQFEASLFVVIQNHDAQFRLYRKWFDYGRMTNRTAEGQGYKQLYEVLVSENVIPPIK